MRYLPFVACLLTLTAVPAIAADTHPTVADNSTMRRSVVLDVPGMTCSVCPITVRKALERVPGVLKVQSSFDTKTASVVFDPARTDVTALQHATADAGYPSTVRP
jgi:mercuric ion binding protein